MNKLRNSVKRVLSSLTFWLMVGTCMVLAWASHRRLASIKAENKASVQRQEVALPVKAIPAERGTLRAWIYGKGTARAVRREFLTFEAQGKVTFLKKGEGKRDLREGDPVHGPGKGETEGELLAHLDDRQFRQDIRVAEASLKETLQQENVAQADLERAKVARALAATEFARVDGLLKKGVGTRQDHDVSKSRLQESEAAVRAAMARLEAARSSIAAARARVKQAEVELERTRIFAPFDGIIAYLNIREGRLFTPQVISTNSEGALLQTAPIVVIDPGRYEIALDIPSYEANFVKVGDRAQILTGNELAARNPSSGRAGPEIGKARIQGAVFSVNPGVNPDGRSVQVRVRTTAGAEHLRDGTFVTCWIAVAEKQDVVLAPYDTLIYRGRETYAFVVDQDSGTAEKRRITSGLEGFGQVEVMEGVREGELLVSKGRHLLVDGARVDVTGRGEEGRE